MTIRNLMKSWANRFLGVETIYSLGDSHIQVFEHVREAGAWKRTKFELCIVPGATAQGCVNPNSKTDALQTYRKYLRNVPKQKTILFCLGEVDCGFVIWYRAKKYGISVAEQFNLSLANYKQFVKEIEQKGYQKIIILSTPLPTIQDDQGWGDVAKLRVEQLTRKKVTVSLKERTDLTFSYNAELRAFCKKNSFVFIDLENQMLDEETGVIKKEFLNNNPLDHHYDYARTSVLLIQKIRALGFN